MKRHAILFPLLTILCAFALVPLASAAGTIEFVALGTDAPPTSLGGYKMYPIDTSGFASGSGNYEVVTSVPSVLGDILFDSPYRIEAREVPDGGWNNWSHGYQGFVFFVNPEEGGYGDEPTLTLEETVTVQADAEVDPWVLLTMPADVKAFIVYATPNNFIETFTVSVQVNDGTIYSKDISVSDTADDDHIGAAEGFGFYCTGDQTIDTVFITCTDDDGFAFGEMAIGFDEVSPGPSTPATGDAMPLMALVTLSAGLILTIVSPRRKK
jgi:hypothetical protein